jgi:AhpD family alkylhydroperoxidase
LRAPADPPTATPSPVAAGPSQPLGSDNDVNTNRADERDLADVFRAHPHGVPELLAYHDILLRGESDLSVAQRELIAAYVSGINACGFCLGAHSIIASTFGISEDLVRWSTIWSLRRLRRPSRRCCTLSAS